MNKIYLVKTAKPIAPKFCVGPHMSPGKVQNNKNLSPIFFDFFKILKTHEKIDAHR